MARKTKLKKQRICRCNRELNVFRERLACKREAIRLERRIAAAELRLKYFH